MIAGRALVTGATGFVGSHLTRRLVAMGLEVHILRREHSNVWRMRDILPGVTAHEADLRDPRALGAAVRAARPDYVFHLAAATVVAGTTDPGRDLIDINVLGTAQLIEACAGTGYRGMVTTGDSFEYSPSPLPLAEGSDCHPTALHGISKLAATRHAQSIARSTGAAIVTLRLFSTYGPADHPRRLVPRVIAGALAGTPLPLSRPEIARDWVHVDDVVDLYLEAALRAGDLRGGIFNAGAGARASLGEIVERILRLTGSRAEPRWGVFEAPEHDAVPWVADPAHTFAHFNWRPAVSLDDGLARTIRAMQEGAEP